MYINENLSGYLNALRGKANALRKEKDYQFIWIKNGNILVRKKEGSSTINIQTTADLNKII